MDRLRKRVYPLIVVAACMLYCIGALGVVASPALYVGYKIVQRMH